MKPSVFFELLRFNEKNVSSNLSFLHLEKVNECDIIADKSQRFQTFFLKIQTFRFPLLVAFSHFPTKRKKIVWLSKHIQFVPHVPPNSIESLYSLTKCVYSSTHAGYAWRLLHCTVKLGYTDHGYNDHAYRDHSYNRLDCNDRGYNDHCYNEFAAVTNKFCYIFCHK